jgi:probable F420-dependent oxidoreductase
MTAGKTPCGIAIPQVFSDTAVDINLIQQFVQKAETLGYDSLWVQESIVGPVPVLEPLSLLTYAAALTSRLRLGTSVMLTVLRNPVQLAKLVASLDQLSQGRLTVGIGIGGHVPEAIFGLPSAQRVRRFVEGIQVMKALWADPYVTFEGKWHRLPDAGINPRPPSRKIPLWFGGHMDVTLQRIAKWGDGWMMLSEPPGPKAVAEFDKLRRLVEAEGRDPASVGLEDWTSTGTGTEKDWREEISFWKQAGVTHVTLHNTFGGYHHKRMAGRGMNDHVDAMRRYRNAVADLL